MFPPTAISPCETLSPWGGPRGLYLFLAEENCHNTDLEPITRQPAERVQVPKGR